jgi:two-component system phosphate regulon sensor histidine kinase PhoR
MKNKNIRLIIGLMSLALIGVMGMQYFFLVESYQSKSQLFDLKVSEALNALTQKTEKFEDISLLHTKLQEESKKLQTTGDGRLRDINEKIRKLEESIREDFKERDRKVRNLYPLTIVIDNDFYETYFKDPEKIKKVSVQVNSQGGIDNNGLRYTDEVRQLYVTDPEPLKRAVNHDTIFYLIDINPRLGAQVVAMPKIDSELQASLKKLRGEQVRERTENREKIALYRDSLKIVRIGAQSSIFEDLVKQTEKANIPFNKRIQFQREFIDTVLKTELLSRGITIPYNYQVTSPNADSVIFFRTANTDVKFVDNNTYRSPLFPKEVLGSGGMLMITFLNKNSYMFKNMGMVLVSSVGLLFILVSCFAYTIFIIFRQKKISEMKTDFINNMTHEFKTPVATIMIASEALKDPEITEDQQRIKKLANIIYDENVRLGSHIERVLNIAKIDRDDLKIEHKSIEMNGLISSVTDSMELQLQKSNTRLVLDLKAEIDIIKGDDLHLSNVLFNLIDNAIKYNADDPEITISTQNIGSKLVVRVRDNGIGMSRDQLSKIFDQFYRIPTGNLHDVKGFGLGLSYVSNIIKMLQGEIHVKSERDKGSEFELIFRTA